MELEVGRRYSFRRAPHRIYIRGPASGDVAGRECDSRRTAPRAPPNVDRIEGGTPNRRLSTSLDPIAASARPAVMPIAARVSPCLSTRPLDARAVCAERHPDPDLPRAAADRVGRHAENADRGEEQRDRPEACRDGRGDALRDDAERRDLAKRHRLRDRKIRVHFAKQRARLRQQCSGRRSSGSAPYPAQVVLRHRHVDERLDLLVQRHELRVRGHSDDGQQHGAGRALHFHVAGQLGPARATRAAPAPR